MGLIKNDIAINIGCDSPPDISGIPTSGDFGLIAYRSRQDERLFKVTSGAILLSSYFRNPSYQELYKPRR